MPLSCRPSLQQKSSHLGGEPSFATSVSNRRLALEADPHTSLQVLRLFNNIVGAPGCQLRLPIVSIILFDAALRYRELVTLIADLALQSPFERGRNFREVPGLENESALKFAPRRWAAKHQLCHFSMSANYSLARYANSAG